MAKGLDNLAAFTNASKNSFESCATEGGWSSGLITLNTSSFSWVLPIGITGNANISTGIQTTYYYIDRTGIGTYAPPELHTNSDNYTWSDDTADGSFAAASAATVLPR